MPKKDFGGIYVGECVVTNKRIVGSSKRVFGRIAGHIKLLRVDGHYNPYLQNSWNKYGEHNFDWNLLEICPEETQYIREQYWIEFLETHLEEFGFNIAFPVRSLAPSPRMSAIHKKLWEDLVGEERDWRMALSRASLAVAHAQWEDPIRRVELAKKVTDNASIAHDRWHNDPEYRARKTQWLLDASAVASDKWKNDPEFKEFHTARLASQAKGASDAANKKFQDDPEYREELLARLRKQSAEISERRRLKREAQATLGLPMVKDLTRSQKAKARWADPEFRERAVAAIRAGRQRSLVEKKE